LRERGTKGVKKNRKKSATTNQKEKSNAEGKKGRTGGHWYGRPGLGGKKNPAVNVLLDLFNKKKRD